MAATATRAFGDRREAGRELARQRGLRRFRGREDAIVLALPRGGVPVAYEVARALRLPLDVFVVRKLGVPGHEELAMGAIASGGIRVLQDEVIRRAGIDEATIDAVAAGEQRQLEQRERLYREGLGPFELGGKHAILVDDGLATGSTMRAGVQALRGHQPAAAIVAVPVAPPETCAALEKLADEIVCAITPEHFYAVGAWYERFEQTSDAEVVELLRGASSAS